MVFPEAFHLGWMGATRRIFQLGKAFRSIDVRTTILAGRYTNPAVQKAIDGEFLGSVHRTEHSGDYPKAVEQSAVGQRLVRGIWKLQGEHHYWHRLSWGWADRLDVQAVAAKVRAIGGLPSFVWGVSTGYLGGAVAAHRLAQILQVPWVLELQDPPRGAGIGRWQPNVASKFSDLCASANALAVTTYAYRDFLIDTGVSPQIVHVVPLSYEGDICKVPPTTKQRPPPWRVTYVGSLSGGRSVAPLLRAWRIALDANPQMGSWVELQLVGSGPGFEEAATIIRELQIEATVKLLGQQQRKAAERTLESADVLVVLQSSDASRLQVPGKVYELLRMSKPIIGIMPESEAAAILERSGVGFIEREDDPSSIARTLQTLWSEWRQGDQAVQMDTEFVEQYSMRSLDRRLGELVRAIGVHESDVRS